MSADRWAAYDWQGDRIKRHRKEIRKAFGFRAGTEEDQERLAEWLTAELCGVELSRDRLAEAVVARCRNDFVEPQPLAPAKVRRLVAAGCNQATVRSYGGSRRCRLRRGSGHGPRRARGG